MGDKLKSFSNLKAKNSNYLLAFIVIELLFIFSFPGNRTEADDGFWFAADVRDKSFSELFNPRFPFYLPLARILLNVTRLIGFDFDVYTLICAVSAIFSGFALLLLYHLLTEHFGFSFKWSIAATLLLLFSYEYWRYSVEAEVYMIAIFFLLLSLKFYFKVKKHDSPINWMWLVIISASAVLFYKPNFIPIYLCFPFLILTKNRLTRLSVYYAASGLVLLTAFFVIFQLADVSSGSFIEYITKGARQSPGSIWMVPVVIASNFVSINWLFGFEKIQDLIQQKMPHKAVEEELFMASGIGSEKYIALVLSLLLLISVLVLIYFVVRHGTKTISQKLKSIWFVLLWFTVYAIFLGLFDPTSNEPWLMLQIPIVIILLSLVTVAERRNYPIFTIAIVLVFIVNLVGGIVPIKDRKKDFNYIRTNWLSDNTTKNDFILSYGPISLIRYLDYYTQASVINLEDKTAEAYRLIENKLPEESNIYVMDDFISPSKAITFRAKDKINNVMEFMSKRHYELDKVDSINGFNTYLMKVGDKK